MRLKVSKKDPLFKPPSTQSGVKSFFMSAGSYFCSLGTHIKQMGLGNSGDSFLNTIDRIDLTPFRDWGVATGGAALSAHPALWGGVSTAAIPGLGLGYFMVELHQKKHKMRSRSSKFITKQLKKTYNDAGYNISEIDVLTKYGEVLKEELDVKETKLVGSSESGSSIIFEPILWSEKPGEIGSQYVPDNKNCNYKLEPLCKIQKITTTINEVEKTFEIRIYKNSGVRIFEIDLEGEEEKYIEKKDLKFISVSENHDGFIVSEEVFERYKLKSESKQQKSPANSEPIDINGGVVEQINSEPNRKSFYERFKSGFTFIWEKVIIRIAMLYWAFWFPYFAFSGKPLVNSPIHSLGVLIAVLPLLIYHTFRGGAWCAKKFFASKIGYNLTYNIVKLFYSEKFAKSFADSLKKPDEKFAEEIEKKAPQKINVLGNIVTGDDTPLSLRVRTRLNIELQADYLDTVYGIAKPDEEKIKEIIDAAITRDFFDEIGEDFNINQTNKEWRNELNKIKKKVESRYQKSCLQAFPSIFFSAAMGIVCGYNLTQFSFWLVTIIGGAALALHPAVYAIGAFALTVGIIYSIFGAVEKIQKNRTIKETAQEAEKNKELVTIEILNYKNKILQEEIKELIQSGFVDSACKLKLNYDLFPNMPKMEDERQIRHWKQDSRAEISTRFKQFFKRFYILVWRGGSGILTVRLSLLAGFPLSCLIPAIGIAMTVPHILLSTLIIAGIVVTLLQLANNYYQKKEEQKTNELETSGIIQKSVAYQHYYLSEMKTCLEQSSQAMQATMAGMRQGESCFVASKPRVSVHGAPETEASSAAGVFSSELTPQEETTQINPQPKTTNSNQTDEKAYRGNAVLDELIWLLKGVLEHEKFQSVNSAGVRAIKAILKQYTGQFLPKEIKEEGHLQGGVDSSESVPYISPLQAWEGVRSVVAKRPKKSILRSFEVQSLYDLLSSLNGYEIYSNTDRFFSFEKKREAEKVKQTQNKKNNLVLGLESDSRLNLIVDEPAQQLDQVPVAFGGGAAPSAGASADTAGKTAGKHARFIENMREASAGVIAGGIAQASGSKPDQKTSREEFILRTSPQQRQEKPRVPIGENRENHFLKKYLEKSAYKDDRNENNLAKNQNAVRGEVKEFFNQRCTFEISWKAAHVASAKSKFLNIFYRRKLGNNEKYQSNCEENVISKGVTAA